MSIDKEIFNFSKHYIKIRKFQGELFIEVWDLYDPFMRLQVPLQYYKYIIDDNMFTVIKR